MFWDMLWKKQRLRKHDAGWKNQSYYTDWDEPGKSQKGKNNWGWEPEPPVRRKKGWNKILVVLFILVILVAVRNWQNPYGEEMRAGLRYVLTTNWNFQPVVEKVVQLGLQLTGAENEFDSGIPRGLAYRETMGQATFNQELPLPVSGELVKEYGWHKDAMDDLERFHAGIDIQAAPGTPVKAVLPGTIIKLGQDGNLGQFVQLNHGSGTYSLYAGIDFAALSVGQSVTAGEEIGKVSPGGGEIPGGGLHFELREHDKLIDPLTKLGSLSQSQGGPEH